MPIKVLVNGAHGKMGQETTKALTADSQFIVVAQTDRQDDLAAAIATAQPQIVVDFTQASSALHNINTIIEANVHPVVGTSGLLPEQISDLQQRCATKKLGGIIVPNFSIAAILMMQFAQQAAKYFPAVEIIEMHHDTKQDSPSGTAIRTAELIAAARTQSPASSPKHETIAHARGACHREIPIHALRLPGCVAHQAIIFGHTGETLTIRHDSLHRESFMAGVKLACQKVLHLQELVYDLAHFI